MAQRIGEAAAVDAEPLPLECVADLSDGQRAAPSIQHRKRRIPKPPAA